MLTILGNKGARFCDGLTRRECLTIGGLGLAGLTWADLLRSRAHGSTATSPGRAIIMVYLAGGPSHIDMYDLKPEAPAEYRGPFKPIQTNVPGMNISEAHAAAGEDRRSIRSDPEHEVQLHFSSAVRAADREPGKKSQP